LERAASQAAAPSRPRHRRATADRAWHDHPRPGRARACPNSSPEGAVVVVGRPKGLRPGLDLAWRAYVRRFDLEHTIRFCKQTLGWTTPRPRHPEQADRWTWLILACYTQLRLARQVAADARLPWERPRLPTRLSPYRVRRGFCSCCACSARRLPRRNPAGAPQADPNATARDRPSATRRSRSPPASPERSRPGPRRPPDRRPPASPSRWRVSSEPGVAHPGNHKRRPVPPPDVVVLVIAPPASHAWDAMMLIADSR
jgi:hypothetical protein